MGFGLEKLNPIQSVCIIGPYDLGIVLIDHSIIISLNITTRKWSCHAHMTTLLHKTCF